MWDGDVLHAEVTREFDRAGHAVGAACIAFGFGAVGFRDMEPSKGAKWLKSQGQGSWIDHGDKLAKGSDASLEYNRARKRTPEARARKRTPEARARNRIYNARYYAKKKTGAK